MVFILNIDTIKKIKNTIKVKGVHTFLQIINNNLQHNKNFKIRLNKEESDVSVNPNPSPNSNKSMLIEYTASNQKSITETYKFGPFNKIYKPDNDPKGFTYSEITTTSEFKKVLDLQGPLMFSFHGPSGSEKSKIFKPIFLGVCKTYGSTHPKLNINFKEIFK